MAPFGSALLELIGAPAAVSRALFGAASYDSTPASPRPALHADLSIYLQGGGGKLISIL